MTLAITNAVGLSGNPNWIYLAYAALIANGMFRE